VDDLLKALAAVALDVSAAEMALDEGAPSAATERLQEADDGLAALRDRWAQLGARERRVLGAAATPVRQRLDAARARLPRRTALTIVAAEHDVEQETDPLGAETG
jgi:hypothetical protein